MSMIKVGDIIKVDNLMQSGYEYRLAAPMGDEFAQGFKPFYTPEKMLKMGVFDGRYLNSARGEYPDDWFKDAKLSEHRDPLVNCFGVSCSQSLSEWRKKGWIFDLDPRGWFEWYCRYYLGRRHDEMDAIQIKRWRAFSRHAGQVRANCEPGDIWCRPRQRQALLHWSYNPYI